MKKNEFERRRERWQTISSVGRGDSQLTVNVREGVSFELGGGKNSPCAGSYMCHARVLIGSGLMQGSSMFFGERDMEQGPLIQNVKQSYILSISPSIII